VQSVRSDQELRAVEERGLCQQKFDLAGPLVQLGDSSSSVCCQYGFLCLFVFFVELHHPGTGTAALMVFMNHFIHLFSLLSVLNRRLIIFRRFPFFKRDRSCGTSGQAVAKPVTEVLPDQLCFSVYDLNGSLMAGICSDAAAVAFFFINMNDLTNHCHSLLAYPDVNILENT
jgi:hypothetical protein